MEIAKNVAGYRSLFANIVYIAGLGSDGKDWVLVDAGVPFTSTFILKYTKKMFGTRKPLAIILTHAHFDHIGALEALVKEWDVPIYIHEKEIPYLQGEKNYSPPKPLKVKGMMSFLSPAYPRDGLEGFHPKINSLSLHEEIPFLKGWKWIHTPGHTEGHISLFREEDALLIAGDALTTVKQESLLAVLTQRKEVHGPPAYFTPDRETALESIKKLLNLNPQILYTGHGKPMYGKEIMKGIKTLLKKEDVNSFHASYR